MMKKSSLEMVYSLQRITLKLLIFIFSTQLFVINSQRVNRINSGKRRHSVPVKIGEYPQVQEANAPVQRQSIFRPDENGDVYEYHRFQHYGFKTPAPNTFSLESMLAFLAPLATLPIITSAALTSLASILPTLTTDGMVKGRSRREAVLGALDSMQTFNYSQWKSKSNKENYPIKRDVRDLDIIQKYLKQMNSKEDYNDEVMASYLQCSGMLSSSNHCLERLVCQFSDPNSRMDTLEKDVSSLIIYTILNNKHIHEEFKERLRAAAFFGRDTNGRCSYYICSRNNFKPS